MTFTVDQPVTWMAKGRVTPIRTHAVVFDPCPVRVRGALRVRLRRPPYRDWFWSPPVDQLEVGDG